LALPLVAAVRIKSPWVRRIFLLIALSLARARFLIVLHALGYKRERLYHAILLWVPRARDRRLIFNDLPVSSARKAGVIGRPKTAPATRGSMRGCWLGPLRQVRVAPIPVRNCKREGPNNSPRFTRRQRSRASDVTQCSILAARVVVVVETDQLLPPSPPRDQHGKLVVAKLQGGANVGTCLTRPIRDFA
jgi:hypothetical protein